MARPARRAGLGGRAAAHKLDLQRSIPLPALAPILKAPGIQFYSLQLGDAARQLEHLPAGRVVDHTAYIKDFADTAAFIDRLDLLIPLGSTRPRPTWAALGKETWMFLQYEPDFRWMADTDNPSRWYPSLRLFRQTVAGDWKSVIERVAKELGAKVKGA